MDLKKKILARATGEVVDDFIEAFPDLYEFVEVVCTDYYPKVPDLNKFDVFCVFDSEETYEKFMSGALRIALGSLTVTKNILYKNLEGRQGLPHQNLQYG